MAIKFEPKGPADGKAAIPKTAAAARPAVEPKADKPPAADLPFGKAKPKEKPIRRR